MQYNVMKRMKTIHTFVQQQLLPFEAFYDQEHCWTRRGVLLAVWR